MNDYQPFPISNFRAGWIEAVEPWLAPREAFQQVINAHLYRGVVESINGYAQYAKMAYANFVALSPPPDGTTKTFTVTLPPGNPLPANNIFTIYVADAGNDAYYSIITDQSGSTTGSAALTFTGGGGGTGTINYTTGVLTLNFTVAPPHNNTGGTEYDSIFIIYQYTPNNMPIAYLPIQGIKRYFNPDGNEDILVFDQKRVGYIVPLPNPWQTNLTGPYIVQEIPHPYYVAQAIVSDGTTVTYTGNIGTNIVPTTVQMIEYVGTVPAATTTQQSYEAVVATLSPTITDNGFGQLTGNNVTSGFINYVTGNFTVTFTVAPPATYYFDSQIGNYGDIFHGGLSNFFSFVNFNQLGFFVNNVDPPMYYDGKSLRYLITNLELKPVSASAGIPNVDLTTALHVDVNIFRLLLIGASYQGVAQPSVIYWSKATLPLVWWNDEFLPAPTSYPIKAYSIINTDFCFRFTIGSKIFRYTGDAFSPFRWDSTNSGWRCDASFSAINYDTYFKAVGRTAIVDSDGVNDKKGDINIPDFTIGDSIPNQFPVISIDETSIGQCYGQRYDDLKEGWLTFKQFQMGAGDIEGADNILAYNYLDDTYSIYRFAFNVLGTGRIISTDTWGTDFRKWIEIEDTWGEFDESLNAVVDLAGDFTGNVFELNAGTTLGPEGNPVPMDVITKNFNPFIEEGQMARLGYVDFFVSANNATKFRVQFYKNDEMYLDSGQTPPAPNGYYKETTLQLNTTTQNNSVPQSKVWKRIYVGAVAKEHNLRIYQDLLDFTDDTPAQPVRIHAMVLYFKPAGRIFN